MEDTKFSKYLQRVRESIDAKELGLLISWYEDAQKEFFAPRSTVIRTLIESRIHDIARERGLDVSDDDSITDIKQKRREQLDTLTTKAHGRDIPSGTPSYRLPREQDTSFPLPRNYSLPVSDTIDTNHRRVTRPQQRSSAASFRDYGRYDPIYVPEGNTGDYEKSNLVEAERENRKAYMHEQQEFDDPPDDYDMFLVD